MSEEIKENDTIEEASDELVAEDSTSEDTTSSTSELEAYKALYEKQQQALNEQIKTNQSLQSQINILLRNSGSTSTNTEETSTSETEETMQQEYVSLAELGREIGKRDYVNT